MKMVGVVAYGSPPPPPPRANEMVYVACHVSYYVVLCGRLCLVACHASRCMACAAVLLVIFRNSFSSLARSSSGFSFVLSGCRVSDRLRYAYVHCGLGVCTCKRVCACACACA